MSLRYWVHCSRTWRGKLAASFTTNKLSRTIHDHETDPITAVRRLHSFHVQDPQIGLPTVKLEQRIVIGTKLLGQTVARDGLVEHAAEPWTIDCNGLHTKADNPAGKLIHDN